MATNLEESKEQRGHPGNLKARMPAVLLGFLEVAQLGEVALQQNIE
jgi:hypothetical protein